MKLTGIASIILGGGCLYAAAETTSVKMTENYGLLINSTVCELSLGSRVIAVEPPWGAKYFMNGSSPFEVAITQDGQHYTAMKSVDNKEFDLQNYSASVADNGLITVNLKGKMIANLPAVLEYSALTLPDYVLAGTKFEYINMADEKFTDHISPIADVEHINLAENLKSLTVKSLLGDLVITVTKGPGLNLVDRRVDPFDKKTCFWLGFPSAKLAYNQDFESEFTIDFKVSQNLTFATPLPIANDGKVTVSEDAETLKALAPVKQEMYPAPKQIQYLEGAYVPSADSTFNVNVALFNKHNTAKLERAFKRILNQDLQFNFTSSQNGDADIMVQYANDIPAEGYRLKVTPEGVNITASTAGGAFYALQTLRTLADDGSIPAVEIYDFPDVALRSIHLCLDAKTGVYSDLVTDLFAPYKVNSVVGEVQLVQWDATKDMNIHNPNGMTKQQFADFVKLCDDNFIDFIPLFQTLGHCGWLFANGRNNDMAEDPETPYAYNVANPKTYPLMTAILDEIFAVAKPKYLHIGHDEVTMRGRYPYRPENVEKGIKQLVFDDVMFYYNYAKENNARIMLWHDMFMDLTETPTANGGAPHFLAELRKKLPRDIIMCLWRYTGTTFPEIKTLQDDGFEVIGCPWYLPGNPEGIATEIHKYNALGTMQTTWAGYTNSDKLMTDNFYQVVPYLRSASWSWNTNPEQSTANYSKILSERMLAPKTHAPAKPGRLVDIANFANLSLLPENIPFLLNSNFDVDKLPAVAYYGNVKFMIPQRNNANAAIAFKSRLNPEFSAEAVTIPLNVKAQELYVLNTTVGVIPPENTVMGHVTLQYENGKEFTMPVRYTKEVGLMTDNFNYYLNTNNAYTWQSGGDEQNLWYFTIKNPHPDLTVKSISFRGDENGFSYYVMGLSLSEN